MQIFAWNGITGDNEFPKAEKSLLRFHPFLLTSND